MHWRHMQSVRVRRISAAKRAISEGIDSPPTSPPSCLKDGMCDRVDATAFIPRDANNPQVQKQSHLKWRFQTTSMSLTECGWRCLWVPRSPRCFLDNCIFMTGIEVAHAELKG